MSVSIDWVHFLGVLMIGALLFRVYIQAPDFWKFLNVPSPEH